MNYCRCWIKVKIKKLNSKIIITKGFFEIRPLMEKEDGGSGKGVGVTFLLFNFLLYPSAFGNSDFFHCFFAYFIYFYSLFVYIIYLLGMYMIYYNNYIYLSFWVYLLVYITSSSCFISPAMSDSVFSIAILFWSFVSHYIVKYYEHIKCTI